MNTPSVREYERALRRVISSSPAAHCLMLEAHYRAVNYKITATQLAQAAGYRSYSAANLQYGKFAQKLCEELSYRPPVGNSRKPSPTYVLATALKLPSSEWEWTLRGEVVQAIAALHLFDGRSGNEFSVQTRSGDDGEQLTAEEFGHRFEELIVQSQALSSEARRLRLARAPSQPSRMNVVQTVFARNPDVVAEVLYRAAGHCESCRSAAPFKRSSDGSPYLEVHHVIPLAEDGPDTIENAVALCPNCHRRMHHGEC